MEIKMGKSSEGDISIAAETTAYLFITVAFIALVWRMIPIDNILKLSSSLFVGLLICNAVILVYNFLGQHLHIDSMWIKIAITAILFLAFPIAINILFSINEKEYLEAYPCDNKIAVQVRVEVNRVGGKGGIGNEWTFYHYLNDEEFCDNDILVIDAEQEFYIKSRFVEHDSIPDIGEASSSKISYASNENYKKTVTISQTVRVEEKGGRSNAGATADFDVTYTLKRVVPPTMGFWGIFFLTDNMGRYFICACLIIGEIVCADFVLYVVIEQYSMQNNN